MKRILVSTAALAAAVVILVAIVLPPARIELTTSRGDDTVPGIIHVHTRRSDGRGTPDDIAKAAARQGLKFVVFTDHGDGTREPEAPVYRSGVLCLDGVEISTTDGHYVALGMKAAQYPLNGEARDVIEDVRRLGGWGVVAHPESPKPGLSWRAWDTPFDAIEWANPDTSWRVRVRQSRWDILEALAAYPFRSAETMARLIGGTTLDPARWNRLVERRRVVIVAGADAHARLGFGTSDPGDNDLSLPIPGYDVSFRTLSIHVQPERSFTGDATSDATSLLEGLRRGHAYVAIDGLASPPEFRFTGSNGREVVAAGDELPGGNTTLTIVSNAPPAWTTNLWSGDRIVASARSSAPLTYRTDSPGIYRATVATSADATMPWIVSNPIYVGVSFPAPSPLQRAAVATRVLVDGRTTSGWWTEHDPASVAVLDWATTADSHALRLGYELRGGSPSGQFVALAVKAPAGPAYERVKFSVRGERSGRLEVQVRGPIPPAERWQRSFYFDQTDRAYSVDFTEMTPIGPSPVRRPSPTDVRDILFVIDTTHTAPGASGRLWITSPVLEK